MKSKHNYEAIGVMSGTSMDGLDIAHCRFTKKRNWEFEILSAVTLPYPAKWRKKLSTAHTLSGAGLLALDVEFGNFIGENCARFIAKEKIKTIDLIASHGHTVFHQPGRQFTFQLGNGNAIYARAGIPVVYDFRSLDVALLGQGAPLVPVGDRYLFDGYDVCVNLGGIANLSMEKKGKRIAFDVCFANMGLNYLAGKARKEFDKGGLLASRGKVKTKLLNELRGTYTPMRIKRPALTREGFELQIQKLLNDESIRLEDRMYTFCESIAEEIRRSVPLQKTKLTLLATGGGTLNPVLMALLSRKLAPMATIIIPPRRIVEFKEALVFAFLGVLRVRGEVNVLKSVTGATRDSCSGSIVGNRT